MSAGENAIGVLLTGMSKDGSRGLKEAWAAGSCRVVLIDGMVEHIHQLADEMDVTKQIENG